MRESAFLILALPLALPAGWASARVAASLGAGGVRPLLLQVVCLGLFASAAAETGGAGWPALAMGFVLGWALLTLAAVDVASLRLPDALTLPLIAAGLAAAFALPRAPVIDHLIGAAAGYGVLAAIGWAFWRWRGREGLGLGDAKLLAAAGAWLGWRPLPLVVLIACGAALAWIAVRVVVRGRASLRAPIAFGAPLCVAIWLGWLYSA